MTLTKATLGRTSSRPGPAAPAHIRYLAARGTANTILRDDYSPESNESLQFHEIDVNFNHERLQFHKIDVHFNQRRTRIIPFPERASGKRGKAAGIFSLFLFDLSLFPHHLLLTVTCIRATLGKKKIIIIIQMSHDSNVHLQPARSAHSSSYESLTCTRSWLWI